MEKKEKKIQKYMALYMSLGMCFGVSVGLVYGMFFFPDNMTLGICFGIPVGMCIGMAIGAAKDKKLSERIMKISRIEDIVESPDKLIYAIDKNGSEN